MAKRSKYLDPKVLAKIDRLDLKARWVVEGFMSGMHKSPYHGFSVEFSKHREYAPGDDTRHIDWKVYSKSDRYYIKQYEVETNFIAHVLLDASESMAYASPGALSKLEYAKFLAASLSYLIASQQDAVALEIFDEDIRREIERGTSQVHVYNLARVLEGTEARADTDVGGVFHKIAEKKRRKGFVIIISDLFDRLDSIMSGLNHFRFQGHEVIIFHILDEYELTFPFDGLVKFEGLESYPEVLCQPRMLKKSYLEELNRFLLSVRAGCEKNAVDYTLLNTSTPLDVALTAYLVSRLRRGRWR